MLESKQPMKQLQSFNTREQQLEMVMEKVIISVMWNVGWFRANDNLCPVPIQTTKVTKNAVVVLYKKINWVLRATIY